VSPVTQVQLIQISKEMNLNTSMCAKCGGECCKEQPGITLPQQWGATAEEMLDNLAAAFTAGRWAIDWWEGDVDPDGDLDDVYFVRPHAVGFDADTLFHGAGHNRRCTFLSNTGCTLTAETRPDGCLALIPNKPHTCELKNDDHAKKKYAWAWHPYQDVVLAAAARVGADKADRETDDVQPWWSSSLW